MSSVTYVSVVNIASKNCILSKKRKEVFLNFFAVAVSDPLGTYDFIFFLAFT